MLDVSGYIVEADAQGEEEWNFVAFFLYREDAEDFARVSVDEPSRFRVYSGTMSFAMSLKKFSGQCAKVSIAEVMH